MWRQGWRDQAWARIDGPWDLIIIGGGVTGAGIFRAAAHGGLKALLLEGRDFASGTSSRSSKLVHGGLRYLRNGQLKTTFQSVRERQKLLGLGRGLVLPLEFLYLIYDRDSIPSSFFNLGLALYDMLGLRWDHRRHSTTDLLKLEPKITPAGLVEGYRYMDAKVDDARLVLRLIQEGVQKGGLAINYAPVVELLLGGDQRVHGVGVQDTSVYDGRSYEVEARVVVNASGASADAIRSKLRGRPYSRVLKGSHIVLPQEVLPLNRAVSFSHPEDKRPVFALPWEGVTLFGTTDIDYPAGDREEPSLSPEEFDYLFSALLSVFPGIGLKREDVQAGFSGVRTVLDTGEENPSREPRDHSIWEESGLITVSGGKLTTYAIIARDVMRKVQEKLPGRYVGGAEELDRAQPVMLPEVLLPQRRVRLIGRYGAAAADVINEAKSGELQPIVESNAESPLWAELRWAARAEGVVHLEDLLLRRVRIGLTLPEGGLEKMHKIRAIVQPELGWDDARWEAELQNYRQLWNSTYKVGRDK